MLQGWLAAWLRSRQSVALGWLFPLLVAHHHPPHRPERQRTETPVRRSLSPVIPMKLGISRARCGVWSGISPTAMRSLALRVPNAGGTSWCQYRHQPGAYSFRSFFWRQAPMRTHRASYGCSTEPRPRPRVWTSSRRLTLTPVQRQRGRPAVLGPARHYPGSSASAPLHRWYI